MLTSEQGITGWSPFFARRIGKEEQIVRRPKGFSGVCLGQQLSDSGTGCQPVARRTKQGETRWKV